MEGYIKNLKTGLFTSNCGRNVLHATSATYGQRNFGVDDICLCSWNIMHCTSRSRNLWTQ